METGRYWRKVTGGQTVIREISRQGSESIHLRKLNRECLFLFVAGCFGSKVAPASLHIQAVLIDLDLQLVKRAVWLYVFQ